MIVRGKKTWWKVCDRCGKYYYASSRRSYICLNCYKPVARLNHKIVTTKEEKHLNSINNNK